MSIAPLKFAPIFRPMIWGGDFLMRWLAGRDSQEPIGEAWILSDEGDCRTKVADGEWKGKTLRELLLEYGPALVGPAHGRERFPLLAKFLDARQNLSVQVHPSDEQASRLRPGSNGKTEAWFILDAEPGSLIYAGLKPGVDAKALRRAVAENRVVEQLGSFEAKAGDSVFLPAGTVHAIGAGIRLFEIQQSSDVTFRLFDWGRTDPATGRPRDVHLDESLACIEFEKEPVTPILPSPATSQRIVVCPYFRLWRHRGSASVDVGAAGECRILVGIHGVGNLQYDGGSTEVRSGQAWLIPAAIGTCRCNLPASAVVLECAIGAG